MTSRRVLSRSSRGAEVNPGCAQLTGAPPVHPHAQGCPCCCLDQIHNPEQSQLGFPSSHSKPEGKSLGENSHLDSSAAQCGWENPLFLNSGGSVESSCHRLGLALRFGVRQSQTHSPSPGSCSKPGQTWICGCAEAPRAGQAPSGAQGMFRGMI